MTDRRSQQVKAFRMAPINLQATAILTGMGIAPEPGRLPVAQLMVWGMLEAGLEVGPAWAQVEQISDRHQDWTALVLDLETNNPARLMRLLTRTDSGDETGLEIDGMDPTEAAATLLDELIHQAMASREPVV